MGQFDDLPRVRLHGTFTGSSRDWGKSFAAHIMIVYEVVCIGVCDIYVYRVCTYIYYMLHTSTSMGLTPNTNYYDFRRFAKLRTSSNLPPFLPLLCLLHGLVHGSFTDLHGCEVLDGRLSPSRIASRQLHGSSRNPAFEKPWWGKCENLPMSALPLLLVRG